MGVPLPLVSTPDLLTGSSALRPTSCTPSTGPANVDGRCVFGGIEDPNCPRPTGGRASAPVYIAINVPYTSGRVAGSNYTSLSEIYTNTRLNEIWATRAV